MQFTAALSYVLYAASVVLAAPLEQRSTSYSGGITANDVIDGGT